MLRHSSLLPLVLAFGVVGCHDWSGEIRFVNESNGSVAIDAYPLADRHVIEPNQSWTSAIVYDTDPDSNFVYEMTAWPEDFFGEEIPNQATARCEWHFRDRPDGTVRAFANAVTTITIDSSAPVSLAMTDCVTSFDYF